MDLRPINLKIKKMVTFSDRPRDILDRILQVKPDSEGKLQMPSLHTLLDLQSGYLQMGLTEQSRPYFSITAPNGEKYQPTRVLFGLNCAPSMFNQTLNRVLKSVRFENGLSVYVDDLLISTHSADEHLAKLDKVLELLIQNDLKCSIKKSKMMTTSIIYLGYSISPQGLTPPPMNEAIDKMANMKIRTKRHIQMLMGFLNFWTRHIQNLASRTFNIRQLLKKETPFKWTNQCESERHDVLTSLRNPEPLQAIDVNQPLFVFTDASKYGYGASVTQANKPILSNDDIEREIRQARAGKTSLRPIAHFSYGIGPHQSRWSSTDLELYGLYRIFSHLQFLMKNRKIIILTDNVGCVNFFKLASNSRQLKIVAFLQSFDLKFYHISGELNTSADVLSRLNCLLGSAEKIDVQFKNDNEYDEDIFAIHSESHHVQLDDEKCADFPVSPIVEQVAAEAVCPVKTRRKCRQKVQQACNSETIMDETGQDMGIDNELETQRRILIDGDSTQIEDRIDNKVI